VTAFLLLILTSAAIGQPWPLKEAIANIITAAPDKQARMESQLDELRALASSAIRFDFAVNDILVTNGSVVRLSTNHSVRVFVKNIGDATAQKMTIAFCAIDTNNIVSAPNAWVSDATINVLLDGKEIGVAKVWHTQAKHLIGPGDRFAPVALTIDTNVTSVRAEISAYAEHSRKSTIGITLTR